MSDYAEQFAMSKYTSSADRSAAMLAELERLRADIHSCGPTCTRAGCVAARLREERDQLRKDVAALNKIIDTRLIDAALGVK